MAKAFDNSDLLLVVGQGRRIYESNQWSTHHSLLHRDGERWIEVGRFPNKETAALMRDALVARNHAPKKDFRIRKVSMPPRA
jgi:hypothetical protein